jgi:phytoene dehydrogenase-like protein
VSAARVVVIGGGHNGLATAALLARGGVSCVVLERRDILGGAAATEEIHPGYRVSTCAHVLGPLRPELVESLDLGRALALLEPEPRLCAPSRDGSPAIALYGDPGRTAFELRTSAPADAERYPEFHRALSAVSALVARVLSMTPPDIDRRVPGGLLPMAGMALAFRGLGREDAYRLLRWGPMAVADFASEWFRTDLMRAIVGARGIFGTFQGPWSAGTTANLLLQAAAGGGNGAGSAVQVAGGLGAVSAALAERARAAGAEIRLSSEVAEIRVRDGAVSGVVLRGGEEIACSAVVSSADPHQTFLRLLDPAVLDPDELRRIRSYRLAGMASKVNFALSGLPSFHGAAPEMLRGRIHVGGSVDELERAYDDAKYGGISRRPYLDVVIPSLADPALAPAGHHVLSAYVQYTPYRLRSSSWAAERDGLGDLVTRTLEEYAPGFSSLVVARQVLTPLDLEQTYGLTGGHPFHGEPSLDQLFLARPLIGWARYRAPVAGLYMCGAGTHPGGGVTGGPAVNAAREILEDLG